MKRHNIEVTAAAKRHAKIAAAQEGETTKSLVSRIILSYRTVAIIRVTQGVDGENGAVWVDADEVTE